MDLTDEAGRAATRRADPARDCPPATTIADLARTDAKLVFVVRHKTTIGSQNASGKREMQSAQSSVETLASAKTRQSLILRTSRATALGALKENQKLEQAPRSHLERKSEIDLKQCADKSLGTKFRKRGNPLYLAFLI
jgi:hypothetical protein